MVPVETGTSAFLAKRNGGDAAPQYHLRRSIVMDITGQTKSWESCKALKDKDDIATPGSGRSADSRRPDRRAAILEAAESMFIDRGFAGTSLAEIVKRSGGSLATVYELFQNKQGLLHAVIQEKREGPNDLREAMGDSHSAAERLRTLAHRLHDHFTQPRSIAIMRIVIQESLRDPVFAAEFHRDIHQVKVTELANVFRGWNAEGKADFDDPDAAAALFFATVICEAQINAMVGTAPCHGPGTIDWRLAPFLAYFKVR
jgi:TetR/AcrR family transcriptional repressor of mexJK operon